MLYWHHVESFYGSIPVKDLHNHLIILLPIGLKKGTYIEWHLQFSIARHCLWEQTGHMASVSIVSLLSRKRSDSKRQRYYFKNKLKGKLKHESSDKLLWYTLPSPSYILIDVEKEELTSRNTDPHGHVGQEKDQQDQLSHAHLVFHQANNC